MIGGTGSIWRSLDGGRLLAALQIAVSYLFGSPSLNYATSLFGIAFSTWLVDSESLTGGSVDIQSVRPPSFSGQPVGNSALVTITIIAVWPAAPMLSCLRSSPFGIVVRTQRRAAIAVESSGVRISTRSLVSLAATLGGSMFAVVHYAVLPESFAIDLLLLTMFMPLLCGQDRP